LLSTGVDVLAGRLTDAARVPLAKLAGVPDVWAERMLHSGLLDGLPVWLLENSPGDAAPNAPPWERAFPVWLAAAAGASTLVTTCVAASLDALAAPAGTVALVSDHINVSGATPLFGLGPSELGAQFPDQSRVHDRALRADALALCARLGLHARECVVACTLGPTLETPAERRWLAQCGAQVSAQGLAWTLIAAAHAGLGGLTIAVTVQAADEELDIARIAARSEALAPALDELLTGLASDVQRSARARLEELGR
jgi:purine-nucleoside phosphorylase